jgi:hypothetical protein
VPLVWKTEKASKLADMEYGDPRVDIAEVQLDQRIDQVRGQHFLAKDVSVKGSPFGIAYTPVDPPALTRVC